MIIAALLAAIGFYPAALAQSSPQIFASVLPNNRTGEFDDQLTYYAAVVNPGPDRIENCHFEDYPWSPPQTDYVRVRWQPVDSSGQILPNGADSVFHIDQDETRFFLLTATASDSPLDGLGPYPIIGPRNLSVLCQPPLGSSDWIIAGGGAAFDFSAHFIPGRNPPDLIPILSTLSGDGILTLDDVTGRGAAAAAVINNGEDGEFIARADVSGPASATLCRSDETGACLAPRSDEVTFSLANGEIALFSILARNESGRPMVFRPELRRLTLQFVENANSDRRHVEQAAASTSVAIRHGNAESSVASPFGYWINGLSLLALTEQGQYMEVGRPRWRGNEHYEISDPNSLVGVFELDQPPGGPDLMLTGYLADSETPRTANITANDEMNSSLTTTPSSRFVYHQAFRGVSGWAGTYRIDDQGYSSDIVTIDQDGWMTGEFARASQPDRICRFAATIHDGTTGGVIPEIASLNGVESNCFGFAEAFDGLILSLSETGSAQPSRVYVETTEFTFLMRREAD